ncbi:MAG: 3-deoxy-8-phosphooctulonate synthase [Deltaproteobacteria bacterium]|nr:3-deoxy-8-phosphooctulonate synthase [Deltaproteobacteria bacterium]
MMKPVRVGGVTIGAGQAVLIAGPCVIEGRKETLVVARELKKICAAARFALVFKASYDKANRTSIKSYRGPGLVRGLDVLRAVREEVGLPVLTDVHHPHEVEHVARVADCLQIPAFLCRQTDLIVRAAATGLPLNIKKGQFMAPGDMRHAVEKARAAGQGGVMLTERGTSFGYHALVVDFRSLPAMRALGVPVVFDATHSVQSPGGRGASSGGDRESVVPLARAAAAVGVDAIYVEAHPRPDEALSDGPNSLDLRGVRDLLRQVSRIVAVTRGLER